VVEKIEIKKETILSENEQQELSSEIKKHFGKYSKEEINNPDFEDDQLNEYSHSNLSTPKVMVLLSKLNLIGDLRKIAKEIHNNDLSNINSDTISNEFEKLARIYLFKLKNRN
jgi:hypothetical protein